METLGGARDSLISDPNVWRTNNFILNFINIYNFNGHGTDYSLISEVNEH